ncbi:hypothetical protein DPMN_092843 [Dreissena polymorpha]|uniref:Uncharacterized protein n=1 Tax=Dreissena polymorpha TaxID=45954 RepID=A0A9D4L228_DREPO|nr:hypothetical protein DPMN_092843 [Dreissena polymorpha]
MSMFEKFLITWFCLSWRLRELRDRNIQPRHFLVPEFRSQSYFRFAFRGSSLEPGCGSKGHVPDPVHEAVGFREHQLGAAAVPALEAPTLVWAENVISLCGLHTIICDDKCRIIEERLSYS